MATVKHYKPGQLITIPNFGILRVTRSANFPDCGCIDCPFDMADEWIEKTICSRYCYNGALPDDCYLKPEIVWKEKDLTDQVR